MTPWRRSDYLFAAIVAVVVIGASTLGIIVERRHRVAQQLVRNPPWLMWGNSQTSTLVYNGNDQAVTTNTQLVKIAYGRPEAWRFLFTAQLLDAHIAEVSSSGRIAISYDVTTGIGRSQSTLRAFALLNIAWNNSSPPTPAQVFTTQVPALPAFGVTPLAQTFIDVLPGQDIQVKATVTFNVINGSGTKGDNVTVSYDAYFTPNVHIRPEWFKGRMANVEDEGR